MDRYADDVAAVLDTLQIERAVVVGLSMGGYVAFAIWRRHRARVRALVLADTRAAADTDRRRASAAESDRARARRRGATAVANLQIAGLVGKTTRDKRPDIYDAMHRMIAQAPVEGIVGALEAMMARPDSTPTLRDDRRADAHRRRRRGRRSRRRRRRRALHAAIPGSRLEVLQQARATCPTSSGRRRSTPW